MRFAHISSRAWQVAVLALAVAACDRHASLPTDPSPEPLRAAAGAQDGSVDAQANLATTPSANGFYPLAIGNRWLYAYSLRVDFLDPSGNPLDIPFVATGTIERELTGTTVFQGKEYVVEDGEIRLFTDVEEPPIFQTILLRQDPAGLYEAYIVPRRAGTADLEPALRGKAVAIAPAQILERAETHFRSRLAVDAPTRAALDPSWDKVRGKLRAASPLLGRVGDTAISPSGRPGGLAPNELLRLAYPLRPGQEWAPNAVDLPGYLWRVESREQLDLPAGQQSSWRIRGSGQIVDPEDDVLFWYGSSGFLELHATVFGDLRDEQGNLLGVFRAAETVRAEEIELASADGPLAARD